ncbi:hypothetical protein C9J12_22670 [Photobacterium frigidiphilum]|uniref:Zona occludens toxin N-terminal domain-containing protein n=1 Tax=Photobacterium frigidiphilum TaxID=264736 RepID=A0A2T3J987_9GAMM|nr:zonular occludens toxin domain-containing protein [Photobacterium frigidiphilum]PSU45373.1 hypothetical protein C9J12_22670 [Photobacterium frigidiphilum]
MLYGISGLPGAGKTLNTVAMVSREEVFLGREIYYHRIPCLMLDYDVVCSFQGWFYGWYMHNNKVNKALNRRVSQIHKSEDRLIEIEDFQYLEIDFNQTNPMEVWLYWLRRIYSKERLAVLDEMLEVRSLSESDLTFEDVKPLNLHWTEFANPKAWTELPNQSVIVVDEVHHFWPTRSRGDVPPELNAISTHRHTGKDLVFITQDWSHSDIFIRRMMNFHRHYELVGADRIARFQKKKYIDISNPFDKKDADKDVIKRPTELYGSYYSTELDTNDNKLSKKAKRGLTVMAVSIVAFILTLFVGIPYVMADFFGDEETTVDQVEPGATETPIPMTILEAEISSYQPVVPSMPWTAPVYANVLEPKSYPDLMCFTVGDECKCVTQQSTAYSMDLDFCLAVAANGLFDPHLQDKNQKLAKKRESKGLFK